jgi:hypothetical protein
VRISQWQILQPVTGRACHIDLDGDGFPFDYATQTAEQIK